MTMSAISSVLSALLRQGGVRLLGAAALVFAALLLTSPTMASPPPIAPEPGQPPLHSDSPAPSYGSPPNDCQRVFSPFGFDCSVEPLQSANVAPGSLEQGYARRCADIANNIANVPEADYTYITSHGNRFGARESSIQWFWGYNAEGEHVSYDGYCPSAKQWLESSHNIMPPQKAAKPDVAPGSGENGYARRCADIANNIAGVPETDYEYITSHGNRFGARESSVQWFWGYNKEGREVSYDGYCPEQKAWLAERGHFTPAYDCPENSTAELFRAAQRGKAERAKRLISECNADINWRNNFNQTPLTWAIRSGNADMVALLLDKGGDVDTRDKFGRAPLHTAALDGDVEMVNVILGHFLTDVNVKDYAGLTPTDWAGYEGHAEVAEVLRENGGVCARWGGKYPALCGVATEEKPAGEIAQREELSCITNTRDAAAGWEPSGESDVQRLGEAMEAIIRRGLSVTLARECLEQGASVNYKTAFAQGQGASDGNMNLLHLAALTRGGSEAEVARLLLDEGANVNARHWAWTSTGSGAQIPGNRLTAVTGGVPADTLASLIAESDSVIREKGAVIISYNGLTPLDYAARAGNAEVAAVLREFGGECRYSWSGALCDDGGDSNSESESEQNQNEKLSLQSDAAREDLTEMIAEGIGALPPSFNAVAAETGLTPDLKVRLNARRDFRWDGADWGLEAHVGAVGEADSQAAFTGVGGSRDFAGGWRAVGAAKVARGWTQLEGGLERGALWASEFSAGFERLGLFYGGDALGFGVSQPLYVEHWEAETADGRRFRGSQLSGRVLNVDASYRLPLPGGENGIMEFSAAVGRESGSESGFEGDALISAEWGF